MLEIMNGSEDRHQPAADVMAYMAEQSALVRAGGFWNCLAAARHLSALLLAEGRSPWIARLRKSVRAGESVFHGPLIPFGAGIKATWTTHYVCCCDGAAYDPVAGRAHPLETYTSEVFGEDISLEIFVATNALASYLAEHS